MESSLIAGGSSMKMISGKKAIDKVFRRRDRYDIPDWQRQKVWNRDKKQRLIDSILRGWKLPKFYFIEGSGENFFVEDGQQRLNTIWEFFSNELSLQRRFRKAVWWPLLSGAAAGNRGFVRRLRD
jgi:hypothetical protein